MKNYQQLLIQTKKGIKMKRITGCFLLAGLVTLSYQVFAAATDIKWGYDDSNPAHGVGPSQWGEYFPHCYGMRQSPIDIDEAEEQTLSGLEQKYRPTALSIKNNGHTIQVDYEEGSTLNINGRISRLLQFHFHTPSEHTEEGYAYPMEAHFVHVDDNGVLTVIGVFIKQGKKNKNFAKIIDNAPLVEATHIIDGMRINAASLMPKQRDEFYHYSGSLTTPPCSEGVNWYVMEEPIEFSHEQIARFEEIMHFNARPVQQLNNRTIIENDD